MREANPNPDPDPNPNPHPHPHPNPNPTPNPDPDQVRHFAGDVAYSCANFLEKNNDSLDQLVALDLVELRWSRLS